MIWASMLSTAVVSFQVPSSSFDMFHRTTEVNSMELVVLLGLFSRFLRRWRTIHRDSEYVICFSTTRFLVVNINMHRILRLAQRPRTTGWPYSRFTLLHLSVNVRCHNVCFYFIFWCHALLRLLLILTKSRSRCWCHCRAGPPWTNSRLHFYLEHHRLRSYGLLDLERQWLVCEAWQSRFRRRNP